MVKIHGNYCGPNWTAGKARPAKDIDRLPYVAPTDDLDAACLAHDRDCARGGCSSKADRRLRNQALMIAARSPQLRNTALLIAVAMTAAERTRSE